MELYILRHGIAETARPGRPDRDRALTSEGAKLVRRLLKHLKAAGVSPELILTSPYRRARETADIAELVLKPPEGVQEAPELAPGGAPELIWDLVRTRGKVDSLMVVGHEPLLSATAIFLLNAPTLQLDLKKGAVVRIDLESIPPRPRGVLRWLVTPRLFDAQAC